MSEQAEIYRRAGLIEIHPYYEDCRGTALVRLDKISILMHRSDGCYYVIVAMEKFRVDDKEAEMIRRALVEPDWSL